MYGMSKNSFSTTAKKVTTATQTHHELLQNHLKSHQWRLPPSKIGEVTIFFFQPLARPPPPPTLGSGSTFCHPLADNRSAITLTKEHQYHVRTKHINVRFHFLCWIIEEGWICLIYCPMDEMVADVFTKALSSAKVKFFFANELGLMTAWRGVLECRGAISHKAWVWLSCISILVPHTSFGTIWDSLYYAFSVCLSTIDY